MKEIREIFETVRTYCGMMFGDAKRPRGEEDKSVTGKMYCHASMPLGILASKSVSHKVNVGGVGTPPYVAKSVSLSDWQIRPTALKRAAFTLAEGATHVALSDKSRKSAFTLDESFTHVAHCDKFRRAAFTLAEVLITLGIIGVVAALTLPTLIQNHQKQVYVTQLKKAYSTINNAYNKMAADEGVVDWNQTYCSSFLWVENDLEATNANVNECFDRIAKQMKVIKYKRYGEPCNETWCEFFGSDSNDYWLNLTSIMVTADGITYLFNCGSAYIDILVDVNGVTKGPNKAGRDVFEFTQKTSDSGSYYNSLAPYGIIYWNPDAWKNCSATNLSTACTAKVLIEGKMNY